MLTQRIDQPHTASEATPSFEVRTSVNNWFAANRRRCAIKKHRATTLHYDLRLEFEGTLLSWALRDGPSDRAVEPRLAVQVEDHDPEYMTSERVIPSGGYGAGPVMLWDEGFWMPLPGYENIRECRRTGCLRFTFECHKLKGNWTFRRCHESSLRGRGEVWELIKDEDEFARRDGAPDILVEAPNSVSTGRTLEEIEQDEKRSSAKHPPLDQLMLIFTFEP